MGARKVTDTHEKLPGYLTTGETEGALEQLHPLRLAEGMMRFQPAGKAPVRLLQFKDLPGVPDCGIHFQAVADDTRIVQEAGTVGITEIRDGLDLESAICVTETLLLFQDRQPG